MTTSDALLEELRALGSEQTRSTYVRHGVTGPQFGVLYGDLGRLKKRVKVDHAAARGLWASGNHDARVLAAMVADAKAMDAGELDRWAREADNDVQADGVAALAAGGRHGRQLMDAWMADGDERMRRAGWRVLVHLASDDAALPDGYFHPFLETIEREIHGERNRVREAMNRALIAIGTRSAALEEAAVAAARRIGPVQVDHGDTSCKTPDAETYIRKARAKRK
jgi:3-methyladenine DNA glycosylase AlkD